MLAWLFSGFFILLFLGVPIAFCLTLVAIFAYYNIGEATLLMQIPQRMFSPTEESLLLAIPFFIMTGEVMNHAKITDKVMNLASSLVGFLRGGLAHTNIMASMLFAGITGSAVSDTVAIGSIMVPAMEKRGYSRTFSCSVTAASSVIGPIIPPSIPMLIYASVMNVSVAALFLGGMIPGILVGVALMIVAYFQCVRHGYGERQPFVGFKVLFQYIFQSLPALLMPVIIIGGILTGFFSPTQAACVAVVCGLLVGFLIYRSLSWRDIKPILIRTVKTSAMIMFLLACAKSFSWLVAYYKLVDQVAAIMLSVTANKYMLLLLINGILLLVGMFLDMSFAIIVLGPLMGPVAYKLGIDPIHFGLIMCVNLTIGLATPPFGLVLFAMCGVAKTNLTKLSKGIIPFLFAEFAVLLVVTYVPPVTLYFPRLFGFIT